jgi:hypothetical protein
MFRNENELLESLFGRIQGTKEAKEAEPAPLSNAELNEIEAYRDADGLIDLTGVKSFNDLKRLVELVDRKNHVEMIEKGTTLQDTIGDLVSELLPLLGVNKASVKVATPAGKASVEVEQGKVPKVVYDVNDKTDETTLTYNVVPTDEAVEDCSLVNCKGCPDFNECYTPLDSEHIVSGPQGTTPISELEPLPEYAEEVQTVRVCMVGGINNPLFRDAVVHICETELFPNADVYSDVEEWDEETDVYILVPNAFGKITGFAADIYSDVFDHGAEVYMIDVETFELTEISQPFDLYDYVMTEAQEESIKF